MAYDTRAKKLAYERLYRAANPDKFRKYDRDKYERRKTKDAEGLRVKRRTQSRKKLPVPTRPEPEFCELCCRISEKSSLCLDHDHETGKFRGWLCIQCNVGLGALGDNLAAIERTADYLRRAA